MKDRERGEECRGGKMGERLSERGREGEKRDVVLFIFNVTL